MAARRHGAVILLMPALAISHADLRRLVAITVAAIEEATGVGASRAAA